jgi:hypothetical protein
MMHAFLGVLGVLAAAFLSQSSEGGMLLNRVVTSPFPEVREEPKNKAGINRSPERTFNVR